MKWTALLLIAYLFAIHPALTQRLSLADSVTFWDNAGDFHKAYEVSCRWQSVAEKKTGKESIDYANALYQVALFQYELGSLDEALKTAGQVLELRKRLYAKPVIEIARTQNLHGIIYNLKGNLSERKRWYQEANKTMIAAGEENNVFYGSVLNNLGTCFVAEGNYKEAIVYYQKSIEAYRKSNDENDLRYLFPQQNLASIYQQKGNYELSIGTYKELLSIRAARGLQHHPDNAFVLDPLIRLELMTGKYASAEEHLLLLLDIRKKAQGENSVFFAGALNLLADYYIELQNFEKALHHSKRAMEILKGLGMEKSGEYGNTLMNMGRVMSSMKKHPESLGYYRQASEIYRASASTQSENYLISINNIGSEHDFMGNYLMAANEYRNGLKAMEELNVENQSMALLKLNLGGDLKKMKRFAESEKYLKEALALYEKLGLAGTRLHIVGESNRAEFFLDQGRADKAEEWYLKVNQHRLNQIRMNFPGFSELEKEKFYAWVVTDFDMFHAYCQLRSISNPAILDQLYDNQLITKALLLNSSAKWKQRIKNSHDRKLLLRFTEWEEYRNRLNSLYQSTDSTERLGIDSLEEKSARLEKELSQRSAHFAELADKKVYTSKDVQAKLKPGEAAVEMIRLYKYGIHRTITDTSDPAKPVYRETGLTDTVFYAALIVKSGLTHPQMVLLENGKDLEGKYLNRYKNLIKTKATDDKSYEQFWKKIADKLKDCNRVYLSPDGVFHQINLNTLYNPATKKYLLEEKDIRLVTVTKDLLLPRREETENKLAYLFGHPSYYATQTGVAMASSKERKSPELEYRLDIDSTKTLVDLPGTQKEVNQVETVLSEKSWEIHNYLEGNAREENLKELYKPRLLHIATHGYFQTDSSRNPLLRSGLMLAGAGKTLAGHKNEGDDDGILTAYEAMNLNLDNTDLVVLSACETGLGEVKNGEGVYGLQRAFKVAGAKSIIMSLWKVDDEATQELMVAFYKNWLSPQTPFRLAP